MGSDGIRVPRLPEASREVLLEISWGAASRDDVLLGISWEAAGSRGVPTWEAAGSRGVLTWDPGILWHPMGPPTETRPKA